MDPGRGAQAVRYIIGAALIAALPFASVQAASLNLSGYSLTYDWEATNFEPTQLRADAPTGSLTTTLEHGWRTFANGGANEEEQCYEGDGYGASPFALLPNGTLQITASPGINATCPGPAGNVITKYVSGIVTTQGNFSQTYGYFECRAKMPAGAGMWPAFWMAAASGAEFPEIDVTEQVPAFGGGGPFKTHWDIHSAKIAGNSIGGWVTSIANLQTGFHAYGVLWTPKTISFFLDGNQVASTPTPADANVPMYMEANISVGGSWAGPPNNDTGRMEIDYIRAFQTTASNPKVVAQEPPSSPDGGGTTLYGAKP